MPIDLNADLGESYGRWVLGDDTAMLDEITSANVACGFHAGDPATLRRTCRQAAVRGVTVGAQVGYPDLAGFGRRFIDMSADDLTAAVIYQIGALDALARTEGTRVRFVKPHGALYHATIENEVQARAVVDGVSAVDPQLPLLGFPDSILLGIAADSGLATATEYFIDRGYTSDGRLIDRRERGALLTDPALATARALDAARTGRYDSLCTHGDTPGAVSLTRRVRAAVIDAGIGIRAFAVQLP